MADLRAVARVTRLMTESAIYNLKQIPADKLDWKPTPEAKSALQVTGEIIGVMQITFPLFTGGEMVFSAMPHPQSLDEAVTQLTEASEQYAAALDAAGSELERAIETPMGTMWSAHAVLFGMIDLVHHHGQLTYIQSLLGDAQNHFVEGSLDKYLGPPKDGASA